jgi:hypothetical protein
VDLHCFSRSIIGLVQMMRTPPNSKNRIGPGESPFQPEHHMSIIQRLAAMVDVPSSIAMARF